MIIKYLRLITVFSLFTLVSCSTAEPKKPVVQNTVVKTIESAAQLKGILDSAGSSLLMLDLYADWCLPCRQLTPILEKVASELSASVTFYKINIDKHPDIAAMFQVSGIPLVVFVKKQQVVQAYMGVQPEAAYRRAIATHAAAAEKDNVDRADGELVDGVRVISLTTATTVDNLYVYRGEEVKIVFDKVDYSYSLHIPAMNVSGAANAGEKLVIKFKAGESGVFPMMCNGKCPRGDGQQFAKVVVLEYEGDQRTAVFKSIKPDEAKTVIEKEKPLLLDVRTPNEFYEGSIAGATLIPLQQLADRIGEIGQYKDKTVIIYCRSGNRSIPASQILIRNGFKKVYNMTGGIIGWKAEKYPVETTM